MKALKDATAKAPERVTKLKQESQYRNERGFYRTREEGVGSQDQSRGSCESRDTAKAGEAGTLKEMQQRS